MSLLRDRDRRALWVAAIAIPALVALRLLVPPTNQWQALAIARAEATVRELAIARETATSAGGYAAALDSLRPAVEFYERSIRLDEDRNPLAVLAAAVSEHTRRARVVVSSTDLLPSRKLDPHFVILKLRIQGTTDSQGLELFLRNLAADTRHLRTCSLSVVQTAPLAVPEMAELLRVDVTVCRLAVLPPQVSQR